MRARRSTDLGRHSLAFPKPLGSSGVLGGLSGATCAEPNTVAGPYRIPTGFRDASPANSVVEDQPTEGRKAVSNKRLKRRCAPVMSLSLYAVHPTSASGPDARRQESWAGADRITKASERRASAHTYKVEPDVVAADIYSAPAYVGRGGWSWYTGATAWLYRAGLESIFGFRKRGSTLSIDPCIPREWKGFEIVYRHGSTLYRIKVENPSVVCRGVSSLSLDGTPLPTDGLVPPLRRRSRAPGASSTRIGFRVSRRQGPWASWVAGSPLPTGFSASEPGRSRTHDLRISPDPPKGF
jgi:hypothetical protein